MQSGEFMKKWGFAKLKATRTRHPRVRVKWRFTSDAHASSTRTRERNFAMRVVRVTRAYAWQAARDFTKGKMLEEISELKEAQIQLISDAFEPKDCKGMGE